LAEEVCVVTNTPSPRRKGWELIDLTKVVDARGNLTYIEGGIHIPFNIERVYYLYDVPGGSTRAGHAHKQLEQLLIAVMGSFDVTLDDGYNVETVSLNRGYVGLYLRSMVWRTLSNFSSGAVCLVLASLKYDELDYFRSYDEFMSAFSERSKLGLGET
jgi:hypothetical protein